MKWPITGLLACATACSHQPNVRLEVERDTLVLYGSDYSFIPVRRIGPSGDRTRNFVATVNPERAGIVTVLGNRIACERDGVVPVAVTSGESMVSFVAACRTALRIRSVPWYEFEPHDPPRSLAVFVILAGGDSVLVHPLDAVSSDTMVAVLRGDSVAPLAVGVAGLHLDYGGVRSRTQAFITETIVDDTLTVASGETRTWRLQPGRYRITVKVSSSHDLSLLSMETEGANCSRDRRDGDTIHCVWRGAGGSAILKNASARKDDASRRAAVAIIRVP